MKYLLALASILFMSMQLQAQKLKESEVPMAVKAVFTDTHPNAEKVRLEKEGEYFEAEIKIDGKEYGYYYQADGMFVAKESEIDPEEIPDAIRAIANGEKIKEASRFDYEDGKIKYEIETRHQEIVATINNGEVEIESTKDD